MQCQWTNKKIDLNLLSMHVARFLEDEGFQIKIDKTENGFVVIGALKDADGSMKIVSIKIYGDPNKFSIEFIAGEDKRVLSTLSPITSFFGIGIFIQRRMKQMDFYDKIEEDFWIFLDQTIASLKESANSAC